MAQAGFTPIRLYFSSTAAVVPTAGNLITGELALNANDGKLYYKNSATNVVSLLADGSTASGNLPGGTAGAIVFQSAPSTTSYLTIGGAGSLLYSNGTLPAYASIGAAGSIVYSTGTAPTSLAIGAVNTVLTSTGSAPQFVSQASLSVGTATTAGTATNVAGGAANRLLYQSGAGVTTFAVAPTSLDVGKVLSWTGSAFTWASAPAATSATNLAGGAAFQVPYQSAPSTTQFSPNFQFNGTYLLVGDTAPLVSTNPTLAATGSQNLYIQSYIYNANSGSSASADIVAYADNSSDASGWIDMSFTSSTYADVAYTVVGANEGSIFMSAPSGAGKSGNLVYATDSTGSTNSHQWYVGGFAQAKGAWKMQLTSTGLQLANALSATYGGTGITSAGTAGNVLTSTGSGWISAAAPVSGPTVAKTYYMAQF